MMQKTQTQERINSTERGLFDQINKIDKTDKTDQEKQRKGTEKEYQPMKKGT